MISAPLPDLAATLARQRQAADMRDRLQTASTELTTGRRTDLTAAAGGDPARLFAIERARQLALRDAEGLGVAEGRVAAAQGALGKLQELTDTIGVPLLAAIGRGDQSAARLLAMEADDAFRLAVLTVNERFGGRSLFAGAALDGPAIRPADEILAELQTVVAAAPDPVSAVAAVTDWFDAPGGGFETFAWLGDAADAPLVGLGGGETETLAPRGDAAQIRAVLKGLALAAVVADPAFAAPVGTDMQLLTEAARATMNARQDLIVLRADLGFVEQRIETGLVGAAGRRAALELAWNAATLRDPSEAAAEFQALETQLGTLYSVMARLSGLTLANFLR